MRKIKVAQIGTGHDHANVTFETLKRLNDYFEIVGFAPLPEDSQNVTGNHFENHRETFEGYRQMTTEEILNYEGLDAVIIEAEDRVLTKYALMAAEKGLNIHMDKPGGISEEEFNRLIDEVEKKQLVFHMGYMYRYNPEIIKLKEDIAAGKLGEIISIEAKMNCTHGLEKRNWLSNYPAGMLYYLGCHMIDIIYSIMGEPEKVIPLSCSTGVEGATGVDFGLAAFKYDKGVSIAQSTAIERGGYYRRSISVIGTRGTVEISPIEWGDFSRKDDFLAPITTTVREGFSENWDNSGISRTTDTFDRYEATFKAFYDYLTGVKENPFTYSYEKGLHSLILKACGE